MPRNLFMIALDQFHHRKLRALPEAEEVEFHGLLDFDVLRQAEQIPLRRLLKRAEDELAGFGPGVDGIGGYYDFPSSCMVPMLCAQRGLPSASLESVLRCEHKYWSRLLQREAAPDHTPHFCAVDPFDDDALATVELAYPFWLKPVKSFNSYLGFKISRPAEFERALRTIRSRIRRISRPFNYVLDQVDVPDELLDVDGTYCVAEEIISGPRSHQCTLEGYAHGRTIHTYGIVDSVRVAGMSSFDRYEYPSKLPAAVQERMQDVARRVMEHIGFENSPFNIEFFWDESRNRVWILEINTRLSQSHCDLFEKVDGQSSHRILVDLALGRRPEFPHRQGAYPRAGKFFLRRYEDQRVARVPTPEELERLEREIPGVHVSPLVHEGMCLSELLDQDSYSYNVANVYVGGSDGADLQRKYDACLERLRFEFEPIPASRTA